MSWKLVSGGVKRLRCQSCGQFVESAWLWFERPALTTACYCETCAERMMEQARGGVR